MNQANTSSEQAFALVVLDASEAWIESGNLLNARRVAAALAQKTGKPIEIFQLVGRMECTIDPDANWRPAATQPENAAS